MYEKPYIIIFCGVLGACRPERERGKVGLNDVSRAHCEVPLVSSSIGSFAFVLPIDKQRLEANVNLDGEVAYLATVTTQTCQFIRVFFLSQFEFLQHRINRFVMEGFRTQTRSSYTSTETSITGKFIVVD